MAGRFSFSVPERRHPSDPWFRLGQVDVTTTVLVAAIAAASMLIYAIDKTTLIDLVLVPELVRDGDVWRLITWPLVNDPTIWTVISLAIFWYFGRELEARAGRTRFLIFIGYLILVPAVIATVLSTNDLNLYGLFGFDLVQLGVFFAFIAGNPFARFFFGVPGWVIGAVIAGLRLLEYTGDRRGGMILVLVGVVAMALLGARAMGLADSLPQIPALPIPGLTERRGRRRKAPRKPKRTGGRGGGDVVAGPWTSSARSGPTGVSSSLPQPPASPDAVADQAELDDLLDKISAQGMDGLSSAEKQRLNELSRRLRNNK
jgi:hypothetical protein